MKQVTRFLHAGKYVGVKENTKDCFGGWQKVREVVTFTGKPYNRYEFDAIYDFTGPEQLRTLAPYQSWRSTCRVVCEPLETLLARGENVISCTERV